MNFLAGTISGGALIRKGSLPIPLGERLSKLAPEGTEVELGIRPEDLAIELLGTVEFPLSGKAAVVEPLGDQVVVTVDLDGDEPFSAVAKAAPTNMPETGARVRLVPDLARAHLFARAGEGQNLGTIK